MFMQRFFIPKQPEKWNISFYFQDCLTIDTVVGWEANDTLITFYLFESLYISSHISFFNKSSNCKVFSFGVFKESSKHTPPQQTPYFREDDHLQ